MTNTDLTFITNETACCPNPILVALLQGKMVPGLNMFSNKNLIVKNTKSRRSVFSTKRAK
jgi:hypothetical protein